MQFWVPFETIFLHLITILSYAIYSDHFVNIFFLCKILSLLIRGIQEYSLSGKANTVSCFITSWSLNNQTPINKLFFFIGLFYSSLYLVPPLTCGLPVLCYVRTPWLASELPAACSEGTTEHTVWRRDSSGNPTGCPDYPWSGRGCHGWLVSWGTVRTI